MKTSKKTALTVKSSLKAGYAGSNHNKAALKVRSGAKAGGIATNHNRALLG